MITPRAKRLAAGARRTTWRALGALAAGAALLLALRVGGWSAAVERCGTARGLPAAPPRSPSEAARREAGRRWMRAVRQVKQELDRIEMWDHGAQAVAHREEWRRRLMAADPDGDLQGARAAAEQAKALARTPDDSYQAAALLAGIECELGERQAAMQHARVLVRLRPRSAEALAILRHAARCGQPLEPAAPTDAAPVVRLHLTPSIGSHQ